MGLLQIVLQSKNIQRRKLEIFQLQNKHQTQSFDQNELRNYQDTERQFYTCFQFWCAECQVLAAPPGARVLATSRQCPVEMFALGDNVFGMQGTCCVCVHVWPGCTGLE